MHLLFVANFASDTGYAWETIERVFRAVGERLVQGGHRVTLCYASLAGGPPERMRGAPFDFLAFDYRRVWTVSGMMDFVRFLRSHEVDALYLTDRPTWSWRYALYRAAGVRRIVVHDRTSGERALRAAPVRAAKRAAHRLPLVAGDVFVAVSDFVRRRLVEVNGTPPERTHRVYNGIDLSRFASPDRGALRRLVGAPEGTRIVFCSGRAQPYKGFQVLVGAAALLRAEGVRDVIFVHCGGGAYLERLKETAALCEVGEVFHFLGERRDVPALLAGATVAVVPSLWAEAFGLTVVEAMAAGVPLVASRAGGIPELVADGETGVLVPPGDSRALAGALRALLDDHVAREEMARRALAEVRARFSLERAARDLHALVSSQLSTAPAPVAKLAPR